MDIGHVSVVVVNVLPSTHIICEEKFNLHI